MTTDEFDSLCCCMDAPGFPVHCRCCIVHDESNAPQVCSDHDALIKALDRAVEPQRINTNAIANDPTLSPLDRLAATLAAINIEKSR